MAVGKRRLSGANYGSSVNPAAVEAAREQSRPARRALAHTLQSRAPGQPTDNRLEQSQHLVGVTYVAIKVLSDQAAGCDVNVYKLKAGAKDGADQDAREPLPYGHPLCSLVRKPNNKETGGMQRRRIVQQLCLTGSAIQWCLSDTDGLPRQTWVIPTGTCYPVQASSVWPEGAYRINPWLSSGAFAYMPLPQGPGGAIIPSDEIIRTDLPHPLVQYDAYSPLSACSLQLDSLESVERSRTYGMKQSIRPSAILAMDKGEVFPDQAELDRIKQEFNSKHGGEHNMGRVVVTQAGTLQPWNGDHSGMGWEAAWSQLCDFVLSVFGVTKSLAFMAEDTSYAALYASIKQFNLLSMSPLLSLVGDTLNVQLVWPRFGEDHFVELTPKKIDDEDLQLRRVQVGIGCGAFEVNELRTMWGYETKPWGNVRAFDGNIQQAERGNLADTDPANDQIDNTADGGAGGMPGNPSTSDAPRFSKDRVPNPAGKGSLPGRMSGMGKDVHAKNGKG